MTSKIPSHMRCKKEQTDFSSLLMWNVGENADSKQETFSYYISLRTDKSDEGSHHPQADSKKNSDWSHPVRLTATERGTKLTVAVPVCDGDLHTRPLCISGFFRQGLHYFVLREHESPSCLIHNKTQVPLCYGHQNPALITAGMCGLLNFSIHLKCINIYFCGGREKIMRSFFLVIYFPGF